MADGREQDERDAVRALLNPCHACGGVNGFHTKPCRVSADGALLSPVGREQAVYESDVESVPCFRVTCSCGYRSRMYDSQRLADRMADEHDATHAENDRVTEADTGRSRIKDGCEWEHYIGSNETTDEWCLTHSRRLDLCPDGRQQAWWPCCEHCATPNLPRGSGDGHDRPCDQCRRSSTEEERLASQILALLSATAREQT